MIRGLVIGGGVVSTVSLVMSARLHGSRIGKVGVAHLDARRAEAQ